MRKCSFLLSAVAALTLVAFASTAHADASPKTKFVCAVVKNGKTFQMIERPGFNLWSAPEEADVLVFVQRRGENKFEIRIANEIGGKNSISSFWVGMYDNIIHFEQVNGEKEELQVSCQNLTL